MKEKKLLRDVDVVGKDDDDDGDDDGPPTDRASVSCENFVQVRALDGGIRGRRWGRGDFVSFCIRLG